MLGHTPKYAISTVEAMIDISGGIPRDHNFSLTPQLVMLIRIALLGMLIF